MNSPAQDIAEYIISESLATASPDMTFPAFTGRMPSSPVECVAVFDSPGLAPLVSHEAGADTESYIERPFVTVRVRMKSYAAAYNKALAIDRALSNPAPFSVAYGPISMYYLSVISVNGVSHYERDEVGAEVFLMNYRINRKEGTT